MLRTPQKVPTWSVFWPSDDDDDDDDNDDDDMMIDEDEFRKIPGFLKTDSNDS